MKKKRTLKNKAIHQTVQQILTFLKNGTEVKTWHHTQEYFRLPTEEEFHNEVKHRRKFAGKTFQEFYDSNTQFHKDYPTIKKFFEQFIENEIWENNIPFRLKLYADYAAPMKESRATRQFLVKSHECNLNIHELFLGIPTACPDLRYDADSASRKTYISEIFSTSPNKISQQHDFKEIFSDGQSYMYCFSQSGYLRMIEYNSKCQDSSKHFHICEIDGPACCAGVMIKRENTIYVDTLSGTYIPTKKNIDSFESILSMKFPITKFIFKKDSSYLAKSKIYSDHPDYR